MRMSHTASRVVEPVGTKLTPRNVRSFGDAMRAVRRHEIEEHNTERGNGKRTHITNVGVVRRDPKTGASEPRVASFSLGTSDAVVSASLPSCARFFVLVFFFFECELLLFFSSLTGTSRPCTHRDCLMKASCSPPLQPDSPTMTSLSSLDACVLPVGNLATTSQEPP